jgi:CBS domain-containing protein
MKIAEIMQRDVVTVGRDTSLKEVGALLVRHGISGVPVREQDGRIAGVVSEADILLKEQGYPELTGFIGRLLDEAYGDTERFDARTAEDAMTSPAIVVSSHQSVAEAARLMTTKHVNRLPVVDGSRLVGIVTRADLVRAFERSDDEIAHEIEDDVLLHTLWIEPESVEVTVEDGVVTLAGVVETRTIAEIISSYVRRVPGVVTVRSGLEWKTEDLARRRRTLAGRIPRRV